MLQIMDPPLKIILVLVMWGKFNLLSYYFPTHILPFLSRSSMIIVGNNDLRSSHFANIIMISLMRMRQSLHSSHKDIVRYHMKKSAHTGIPKLISPWRNMYPHPYDPSIAEDVTLTIVSFDVASKFLYTPIQTVPLEFTL